MPGLGGAICGPFTPQPSTTKPVRLRQAANAASLSASMAHRSVKDFLASAVFSRLPRGVITVLFCEEDWLVAETLAHIQAQRPGHVLAVGRTGSLADDHNISVIQTDLSERMARVEVLNTLIQAMDGRWIHWLSNGEFLFYPWSESRSLGDVTQFLGDERRRVLYCYAIDLYAPDLPGDGEMGDGEMGDGEKGGAELWFDREAYHAFPEEDRRLTVFGGLGWRFEEFFPERMQQIGRPAIFRAEKGVKIGRDLMFEETAYRSVSAPWHSSPTGAVMTLRRSRHLLRAPGFEAVSDRLIWDGSERFGWRSDQLLSLGMIEPGQWF